ncbi:MAG: glycosyltransferase family 4 protein [Acidimicrobiales bacterium]
MRHQANGDPLVVALDATPLLGVPTGVGVFCREAIGALSAAGELQVEAFAISWRRRHMLASRVPEGVRTVGRAMPARPLHLAWRHSDLPPVEWFLGRCDVVHGTNFVVPPTRRAASVVTVHDLTILRFPEMCDAPTLRFPALVRRAVAGGAWVHTPSQYVAREVVAELGVDPDRVRAVHHGTPTLGSAPAAEQSCSPLPPPGVLPGDTTRYVLAIGTAEPRKDLPSLVRAFGSVAAAHRDVALVLAGPQGWGSAALADSIARSPFSSRIVVTGFVPDLGRLLRGAAVLAYPSLYEGFGLPTLEAMAAGTAVVTTTAGALPEVVGDAALLVPPGDSDALGAALERLLSDESERLGLVERGHKRASMFTWEACAEGLTDLYKEAAGGRR